MVREAVTYKIILLLKQFMFGFIVVLIMMKAASSEAKIFGKNGHSFEIREEGFLEMIYRKLKAVDIEKEQQKMISITKKKVAEPKPVATLKEATSSREYTFDPTYKIVEDIVLPNGKLLYKAGTLINPLDKMEFDRKLYFIDARKKNQVKWLKLELEEYSKDINSTRIEARVVIVGGRPQELSMLLGREVYFDQFGELTGRFKIECVPATLEQDGRLLKIREININ